MTPPSAVEELRRAAYLRLDALSEIVQDLRGQLAPSRAALANALTLVGAFPSFAQSTIEEDLAKALDDDSRVQVVLPVLQQINYVLNFVETLLSHGTRTQLSEGLADEIRQELQEAGLTRYGVILSHGEAHNFTTLFGDLRAVLFGPLARPGQEVGPSEHFAFFRIPRLEGAGVPWRPILLGHEVAHILVQESAVLDSFNLTEKFDFTTAGTIPNPLARSDGPPEKVALGLYKIAESWARELLCDSRALLRYGPAAVAALGEFLTCIGAMETPSESHPPGALRLLLLREQLGPIQDQRLAGIVAPWFDSLPDRPDFDERWASYLAELFVRHPGDLASTAGALPGDSYDSASRVQQIHAVADRLSSGVPGACWSGSITTEPVTRADVVNAAWISRADDAATPYARLAQKTLEDIDFVARWREADGFPAPSDADESPVHDAQASPDPLPAVLAAEQIQMRLHIDDARRILIVTPLLHAVKETGIDLRLGRRFIVFRRSAVASLDPLDTSTDPRSVQTFVELSLSEPFVLHPHEVVLGATLEYLVMPDDLSGQVITRSSYGRLGLLSATAVQVHPGFHGCLTLELVNLSTIPITLTPGERIAQLVLWQAGLVDTRSGKYNYSIGPEFSRVQRDGEAEVLRKMRRQIEARA